MTEEALVTGEKYLHIEDAKASILQDQRYLRRLDFELSSMPQYSTDDLAIKTGPFANFADYFFDSLIVDWIIQSRLKESTEKIESLEQQLMGILNELREKMTEAKIKAKVAENIKQKLLDSV